MSTTAEPKSVHSQIANRKSQMLAWQGWQLSIPPTWNPVKIEGDYDQGTMLVADMTTAKLGIRWRTASKRGKPDAWAKQVFTDEISSSASEEANDVALDGDWRVSRLYEDPDPPGRDLWIGWSQASGRVIEIVYHVKHREPTFSRDILPTIADTPNDQQTPWSVFDFSFRTPAGLRLQWYKLNAGDLSLAFSTTRGRQRVVLRQIGPATLAISRQSLERWLFAQQYAVRKMYRPPSTSLPTDVIVGDTSFTGLHADMPRRRRLFWAGSLIASRQVLIGVVDTGRNRLLIGQGESEAVLRQILASVGLSEDASVIGTAGESEISEVD